MRPLMTLRLCCLLLTASAAAGSEPGPAADLEAVFKQADAGDWRTRWGAVRQMVRLAGDDAIFSSLRPALLKHERPRVRAAVAWAALLEPRLCNATLLGLALKRDPDPRVRRAAAQALAGYRDRRAVGALIAALAKEQDPRARLHIVASLRELTPAPCLLEPAPWQEWWNRHKDDGEFRPADEPARKGTYEGIELETRTVAAVRKDKGNTRPAPTILVLPPFGYSTAIYGPYLAPLRRYASLVLVRLPGVQTLTGKSGFGDDIATYPVDRLVAALDRFRSDHRIERFLILAQGASGWVAMRYARRYFERCGALVLVDTPLDRLAYGEALRRASARGTRGAKFAARTLMGLNSVPLVPATLERLQGYAIEAGYADRAELEIAHLYARTREPQGFATVPPIEFKGRMRIETPTLWIYSAGSAASGHVDAARIGKHFPNSMVAPVLQTRARPFVEQNAKFHEIVETFLKRRNLVD